MKKLVLEFRDKFKYGADGFKVGNSTVMMTPALDEDFWVFRIKLYKDQAIVGFPKFTTIGIGFALEDDWNTNLPYQCEIEKIYNHIKKNKKYKEITKAICIEAINIMRKAAVYYMENEKNQPVIKDNNDLIIHYQKIMKMVKEHKTI